MRPFALGFAAASLLWGGLLFAYHSGVPMPGHDPSTAAAEIAPEAAEPSPSPHRTTRRRGDDGARRRPLRSEPRAAPDGAGPSVGEGSVGDELDEVAARELNLGAAGGEERLPASAIEAAFDAAMPSIRRCLILIEASDSLVGTLRFQLRIAPSGEVSAARLSGPRGATSGEAGACLHAAARSLRFDSFDGPEMDVSYPLHLE